MSYRRGSLSLARPSSHTLKHFKKIWEILEMTSRTSPTKTNNDDPISTHLRNYFDRLPEVIIAFNYEHCRHACRELGIPYIYGCGPPFNPILISTSNYDSVWRLRGRRFARSKIHIYETAWQGEHMNEILYYLKSHYVG